MTNPDETLPVELLGCPFCGGKASVFKARGEGPPYIPCCTICSASLSLEWIEEEAERAWNRRAAQSPPPVSEGREEDSNGRHRTPSGETLFGYPVAAYRETHPDHGASYGHIYSEHWSTPNWKHPEVTVERLFTEADLRRALSSPSPGCDAETIEARLDADKAERELSRLYNYTRDDSRQFTRWQMIVAMQHGYRIATAIRNLGKGKG